MNKINSDKQKVNDLADSINVLKGFLSIDFSLDPNMFSNSSGIHRTKSEERKISRQKLNKFITFDHDPQSDLEQEKSIVDCEPIKEEESERSTPILKSKVKVIIKIDKSIY